MEKGVLKTPFQGVTRMILESDIEKVVVNRRSTYNFSLFRTGKKHMIGMYDEINSFVSYVKDAAEGGSSAEMAYVLVGEPGNGKTFFVEFLCNKYRAFLSNDRNRKYTFRFINLNKLGNYGRISYIESQTYEDPLILAMNLFEDPEKNKTYLADTIGFSDLEIDMLYENYRPLGACSEYIWNDIRNYTNGKIDELLEFVEIFPVPLTESLGTVTGEYPAKDKITSSSVDLLGEESIQRLLHITDTKLYHSLYDPYVYNLKEKVLDPFIENENFRHAVKDYGEEAFKTYDKKIRNDVTFLMNNLCDKSNYTRQGAKEVCIYVIDNDLAKKFLKS